MTELTVLLRMACRIRFVREEGDEPEYGVAVCTNPSGTDIVCIIPDDSTTKVDILTDVWKYDLMPWQGCLTWPVGVEG